MSNGVLKRMLRLSRLIPLFICVLLVCNGCKKTIDNGYHVVAYDGAHKEWTLIDKDFDRDRNSYHRKRFVLACSSYEYNRSGFKDGPDACELHVGDVFETDFSKNSDDHVYVDPENKNPGTGDVEFYIDRSKGQVHEVQFLKILKEEVLPDEK